MIGVKSLNYGASTGSYTFTGTYSGNAMADLLLGYPQSGNIPLNNELDGFVRLRRLAMRRTTGASTTA